MRIQLGMREPPELLLGSLAAVGLLETHSEHSKPQCMGAGSLLPPPARVQAATCRHQLLFILELHNLSSNLEATGLQQPQSYCGGGSHFNGCTSEILISFLLYRF